MSGVRVELHPEAEAELRSAARWYDDQRPGLGDDLMVEVDSALARIAVAPESFPVSRIRRGKNVFRKAHVDRFPYTVAFQNQVDRVFVWAVAHAKRRPLYWLTRAKHDPR